MPVYIQCSSCNRRLRVRTDLVGKTVRCPRCKAQFLARAAEEQTAPPGEETSAATVAGADEGQPAAPTMQATTAGPELTLPPTIGRPAEPPAEPSLVNAKTVEPVPVTTPAPAEKEAPAVGQQTREAAAAPSEIPAVKVFVVLGLVLLLTMILGVLWALWISSAIRETLSKHAQQAVLTERRPV